MKVFGWGRESPAPEEDGQPFQVTVSPRVASPDNTQNLIGTLELVLRELRPSIADDWFTVDLTMPQLRVLFALRRHGNCRMGAVASQLGVALSSATGLIDRLVERNLVERWVDPDDRRSVVCRLSSEGQELAERLLFLRRSYWEERLSRLTDGEADQVRRGLRALLDGMGRVQDQQRPATTEPITESRP